MLIAASKLKIKPSEVQIDPVLSGVAHVRKRIGERVHEAWIDARSVGPDYIHCFPQHVGINPETRTEITRTRNIKVGDFTWLLTDADFASLEWIPEPEPSVVYPNHRKGPEPELELHRPYPPN